MIFKKTIMKITSLACATAFALSVNYISFDVNETYADVIMNADTITENMQIGWNLGNSLDATGASETSWGNPVVTKELIDAVKAKGFNTIRIPTTWYQHLDAENNINEAWIARVKEVVDYAYSNDMYVILNLHHEEWINRTDFSTAYDEMSPKLIKLWTQIATYFADYDQHLIFEGMNEPREVKSAHEWSGNQACYDVVNQLNTDFVNTVRSIDSEYRDTRLLMIPTYAASAYSAAHETFNVPDDDDYIAVSLHAYSPYEFTMADGTKEFKYVHDEFNDGYKAQLDSMFASIRYYFTNKDIPVVLGEFSASNYDNTQARQDWAEYYITATKKLGIPCVLWDNNTITNKDMSESHGYINRSNLTWYEQSEPVVDTMMSVINDDSIVWGSEKHIPEYIHEDINSGEVLYSEPSGVVIAGEPTSGFDVKNSIAEGKEIAVKFLGTKPSIALVDSEWDGWTEISPYDIDETNGIAYYSFENISSAWGDTDTIKYMFINTSGATTVYLVSAIGASVIKDNDGNGDDTDHIAGDANCDGKVSVADVVAAAAVAADPDSFSLSEQGYINADVHLTGDGISVGDASLIQEIALN